MSIDELIRQLQELPADARDKPYFVEMMTPEGEQTDKLVSFVQINLELSLEEL